MWARDPWSAQDMSTYHNLYSPGAYPTKKPILLKKAGRTWGTLLSGKNDYLHHNTKKLYITKSPEKWKQTKKIKHKHWKYFFAFQTKISITFHALNLDHDWFRQKLTNVPYLFCVHGRNNSTFCSLKKGNRLKLTLYIYCRTVSS